MTVYQILCLCGVPTLITGVFAYLYNCIRAVKCGVQALLRAQLISDYNHYSQQGYAPIYARENFINVWSQYHALGKNGVMDDLKQKFLNLPTTDGGIENEKQTS